MRKELNDNYDISADRMVDITETCSGFLNEPATFYSFSVDKYITKQILISELELGTKQIFKMNDGLFILEIEDGELEYYCSKNLNDLI